MTHRRDADRRILEADWIVSIVREFPVPRPTGGAADSSHFGSAFEAGDTEFVRVISTLTSRFDGSHFA